MCDDPQSLARDGFCGERFDALVSCLASRTGAPADAWAIDHQAHLHALAAPRAGRRARSGAAVGHLRAEAAAGLPAGQAGVRAGAGRLGLTYSIVRPTAFFKSLSGQVERVRRASPSCCSATAR
jgi:divinyl chlorophyllide a 8-vinyl-reductase